MSVRAMRQAFVVFVLTGVALAVGVLALMTLAGAFAIRPREAHAA